MTNLDRHCVLSEVRVYEDSRTFGHVWTGPKRPNSDKIGQFGQVQA
jgi:hypothetical protein